MRRLQQAPLWTEQDRAAQAESTQDLKQRQMVFLNRSRQADPQQRTVDRALINEQNELGPLLDRPSRCSHARDDLRAGTMTFPQNPNLKDKNYARHC